MQAHGGGGVNPIAAAASALLSEVGATVKCAVWTPFDTGTLYQDTGETTAVGAGDPVRVMKDQTANGLDLIAPSDAARPLATNGLTWDGSADRMRLDPEFPNLSFQSSAFFVVKTTQAQGMMMSTTDPANRFSGTFSDGSASATSLQSGTTAEIVDGVTVTSTRDGLHTAIADGSWHVVEIQCELNGYNDITFGTYANSPAGWYMTGGFIPIAVIDRSAVSDVAATRAAAKAYGDAIIASL